jgi:putative DNA primase/helicase
MINRRFDDPASCLARKSPTQALACKPQIHSPASGNGGHESALSLLITPVLRGALEPAVPLHLVTAPAPGSGKSYLADIASMVATGHPCAVKAASPNPEETEKRLISAVLSGYPIIALDNCSGTIQGDFLCRLTERPLLQLRPLGKSDVVRVTNTFTVLANGNNVLTAGDMVRRTIQCALDANLENPHERRFLADPIAAVIQNRGAYVAACLIIVRAYICAGRPGRLTPLPSYGGWSDLVRSPLVWLGRPDPVLTMNALRGTDPVRQTRASVFSAWAGELELGRGYLTSELANLAQDPGLFAETWMRPMLREALLEVARARSGAMIDTRRLAHWLRGHTNTIADGYKLIVDTSDKARPRWVLKRC